MISLPTISKREIHGYNNKFALHHRPRIFLFFFSECLLYYESLKILETRTRDSFNTFLKNKKLELEPGDQRLFVVFEK
jgi:hypothetical protein